MSGTATDTRLAAHGLNPRGEVHWNLSPAVLYETALARGEGRMAHMGAFSSITAPFTGRSPNDKFIVREADTEGSIDWGSVNAKLANLRPDVRSRAQISLNASVP